MVIVRKIMSHPQIIQGGMGVGVSGWKLANAVSQLGQLGVVSGTSLDVTLVRRLQLGDPGGHMRRAMDAFPFQAIAQRIHEKYFIEGGKADEVPFANVPLPSLDPPRSLVELTVLGNFVEVWLAKDGHSGVVGINYLEKIQLPTLPSIYGAMLAGVDYVLMGAGIPRSIPGILDGLSEGRAVHMRIEVEDAERGAEFVTKFDPADFCAETVSTLKRPNFFAIISSATLAMTLARKSTGKVNGFIVEGPVAGGHNAPPRGAMQLTERGEPLYGERDAVELDKIIALGIPFWLAGDYARPGRLRDALALGASGVQVGTAFAYCAESGVRSELKARVLQGVKSGDVRIFTDPLASPTGFPFKAVQNVPGVIGAEGVQRTRVCDLGYLRHPYQKENGEVGYRCPAEPVEQYVRKGGAAEDAEGRVCLCNGLMATVGLAQVHRGEIELPLLTAGDDLVHLGRYFKGEDTHYTAAEVIAEILR